MSGPGVLHDYITLRLQDGDEHELGTFPEAEGIDIASPDPCIGTPDVVARADLNQRAFLPEGSLPYHARGLRIALAMKGGVSLAVWIGGAVAELDVLRRIRVYRLPDEARPRALFIHPNGRMPSTHLLERADVYARLLSSRGYDRVEFDVLAGASAGGLNAVMYAVAQRAGVDLEGILPMWLNTASAWELLQRGRPAAYDSLFRGDEYFWDELHTALKKIAEGKAGRTANPPHPALAAPHVVVDLSATLIDAKDTSERSAAEGRAHFRFVGADVDAVPDRGIPARPTEGVGTDDGAVQRERDYRRLAYAARTTSSFPGAFEPALIYSGSEPLARRDQVMSPPDMRNVFSAHRHQGRTHPFRVVDGGVMDNIPIDRALRAVRNIPANEHLTRALVYLDPSPKETSHWLIRATEYDGPAPELPPDSRTQRTDPLSRFLSPIITAIRKRASGESGDDEIEAVDAWRTASLVSKGRDEMLAVRLDGGPVQSSHAVPPELTAVAAFARMRSTTDAEYLRSVLTRPGEWMLGSNLTERPPRRALDRVSIGRFEKTLRKVLDDFSRGTLPDGVPRDAIATGSQTLVDATFCALTWVRAIEDQAFRTVGLHVLDAALRDEPKTRSRSRASLRECLYSVMTESRDRRDLAVARTLDAVDEIPIVEVQLTDGRAHELVTTWLTANAAAPDRRRELWAELDRIVAWLQWANVVLRRLDRQERWKESPWSRLPEPATPLPSRDLPLIFAGSGMPTAASTVRFQTIGSDTQPAAAGEYRTLMDAQVLEGYRSLLAKSHDQLDGETVSRLLDDSELRSSSKLAGLRIANFAGFLSEAWRRNDWWWGRLDASAGILRFLASMDPAPELPSNEMPDAPGEDDAVRTAHDALLLDLNADDARPYEGAVWGATPTAIRERMVRGTQDIESLRSGYRVALASRAIRSASAAMVRGTGVLSPTRVLHWLIRPLMILAPMLLSPPRLILSLVIIACGMLLAWPQLENPQLRSPQPSHWLLFGIAAAVVGSRLIVGARAHARRRGVAMNHTVDGTRARQVIDRAEQRARQLRTVLVIITILLGGLFVLACLAYPLGGLPFWLSLAALIVTTEVTNRALQSVPPARKARPGRWVVLAVLSAAAFTITAFLPTWLAALGSRLTDPWDAVVPPSIAAAIVAGALAMTLLFQALRPLHLLLVIVVIIAATAVAVGVTWYVLVDTLPVIQPGLGAGSSAQAAIAFVVSAWVVGTVIWWAPWFRGLDTGKRGMPTDAVHDLEPGSLVRPTGP